MKSAQETFGNKIGATHLVEKLDPKPAMDQHYEEFRRHYQGWLQCKYFEPSNLRNIVSLQKFEKLLGDLRGAHIFDLTRLWELVIKVEIGRFKLTKVKVLETRFLEE